MKALDVYQTYLAVKQHFSDSSYDYFKYNGKIRVNASNFHTRKDRFFYEKLARKFDGKPEDLRNYFACNLRENPKVWIRELVGVQAEEIYTKWKGYQESLTYNLIQDVTKVEEAHPEGDLASLFLCEDGQHPFLLDLYTNSTITIETLIGFDILMGCFVEWNKEIDDTIIWPDIYLACQRYRPFLTFEPEALDVKFRRALLKVYAPRDSYNRAMEGIEE